MPSPANNDRHLFQRPGVLATILVACLAVYAGLYTLFGWIGLAVLFAVSAVPALLFIWRARRGEH